LLHIGRLAKTVIARLDRATQDPRIFVIEHQRSGILGHPLSRVVTAGFVVAVMLAAFTSEAAFAQEAIKAGDILTGRLRLVRTRHPNGTRIDAYQIVSVPRMMPADDDFCEAGKGVTTFHLFAMKDAEKRQLQPLLGKTITVKADALFCSETAWHIGDVAVPQWTIRK
jgi:hypothetical protein